MKFRLWLEMMGDTQKIDMPFTVEDQNYVLRFFGRPTYRMFPNGSYPSGMVYEIVWFPAQKAELSRDDKYARTGGNSLSHIRGIINAIVPLIKNWISTNNPVGFYWHGDDPKLQSLWQMVARRINITGYVLSQTKNNIYVQERLQPLIDKFSSD